MITPVESDPKDGKSAGKQSLFSFYRNFVPFSNGFANIINIVKESIKIYSINVSCKYSYLYQDAEKGSFLTWIMM